MRRATTIAATVAAALTLSTSLTACDDLGAALDPDPSTRPSAGSPAPPLPPRSGRAVLSVDGDARATLVFGALSEPAIYAGGEGPLSLVWRTSSFELFTLGGEVRLGSQPTSTELIVQLAVDLGDGLLALSSDDGSCTVTVDRAARRHLAGQLVCRDLTDADRTTTIDVEGTFEAGGGDG